MNLSQDCVYERRSVVEGELEALENLVKAVSLQRFSKRTS